MKNETAYFKKFELGAEIDSNLVLVGQMFAEITGTNDPAINEVPGLIIAAGVFTVAQQLAKVTGALGTITDRLNALQDMTGSLDDIKAAVEGIS